MRDFDKEIEEYREWYESHSRWWRFNNWIAWRWMYLKAAFTGGPTEWEKNVAVIIGNQSLKDEEDTKGQEIE